jgi:tetratricopeptide (TPR) repeat protein
VNPTRALATPLFAILLAACAEAPPPPASAPAPDCAGQVGAVRRAIEADNFVKTSIEQAAAGYEEALRLDPSNHRILFKLAMARRKMEDWDAVAKAMAHAVEIAPSFANYWLELGYAREMLARRRQGPWADAKAPFERCAALDPNLAICHAELGNVLLHLDDEHGALAAYTRAIERDPTDLAEYTILASLYLDLGHAGDAAAVLTAAQPFLGPLRQDKALYNFHVLWARFYQDRGTPAEMTQAPEAARAAAPPDGPEAVLIPWNLGAHYASLTPPRRAEAAAMLKGFVARACKGAKAATYRAECEQAALLLAKLGEAVTP